MNLRHAAALALVGWYLIIPPSADVASDLATGLEPLWQWFQIGSFDSENACQQGRHMMISRYMADLQNDPSNIEAVHSFDAFYYSQCVASDDPRLNGNKTLYSQKTPVPVSDAKMTPVPRVKRMP
jgi:hypothetical protein